MSAAERPDPAVPAFPAATLTVDLPAIVANFALLAKRAAPAPLAAVVKADAYGLGAVPVALALKQAGCTCFFVAELSEAITLLPHIGAGCDLYVLNGLRPGAEEACADLGAVPVLNALDQAERWSALAGDRGTRLPAAIQVDSGMSRLGMTSEDVDALLDRPEILGRLRPLLLMSHFACADDPAAATNGQQIARFRAISARFPAMARSLANSAGIFLGDEARFDLARAGIALYGGTPQEGRDGEMARVVDLRVPIIQVRELPAGAGLGYGLTGAAERARRIATVATGYADGWPRRLGNVGSGFVGGVRVPIVGRISMDSMMFDVTGLPDTAVAPGAMVELLGPNQGIDDVARDAETIAYEILTQLGRRYVRRYITLPPPAG
ncbi:alanine racemase [Sphingomonas profundi]|uniref:alanine racemase n=1 Tax=Alterirhizorhabdus profundi TaxID=2681549 RepID=UPI0012E7C08B|nr:alanine racemase [Sphingomonas profundi]